MTVKRVFLRTPAMGGGECKGTRAARGGEWLRDAMRAGGALCAFLLVAWMAAVVAESPTVPDATAQMAEASQPLRERGVGRGRRARWTRATTLVMVALVVLPRRTRQRVRMRRCGRTRPR